MRVVCVDDSYQEYDPEDGILPNVKIGCIYNVVEDTEDEQQETKRFYAPSGVYYRLAETGDGVFFHSSMFVVINEDQQDETEMEREYKKELA